MTATSPSQIETYPFAPILPENARVLMMGSFPPPSERWGMHFHYANFQNDMWRIFGVIFFGTPFYFMDKAQRAFEPERIEAFLREKGIASHPTVLKAIRRNGNASDKDLEVVEAVDLENVLAQLPNCRALFTTGGKASEVLLSQWLPHLPKSRYPKTQETVMLPVPNRTVSLTRLPSSSRAYPLGLLKKAEIYRHFFQQAGLL